MQYTSISPTYVTQFCIPFFYLHSIDFYQTVDVLSALNRKKYQALSVTQKVNVNAVRTLMEKSGIMKLQKMTEVKAKLDVSRCKVWRLFTKDSMYCNFTKWYLHPLNKTFETLNSNTVYLNIRYFNQIPLSFALEIPGVLFYLP